jgi:hypothetical protein
MFTVCYYFLEDMPAVEFFMTLDRWEREVQRLEKSTCWEIITIYKEKFDVIAKELPGV